jgi:hypothetical protein
MNIIYSHTIYLDRGRLPKRGKYGKTSGLEEVHKRVIKDLGRIPRLEKRNIRENSCLRTGTLTDSKGFCENSGLGKEYPGKLQAL